MPMRRSPKPRIEIGEAVYLAESEVADMLGVSRRLLKTWRDTKKGPKGTLVARSWYYGEKGVEGWLSDGGG